MDSCTLIDLTTKQLNANIRLFASYNVLLIHIVCKRMVVRPYNWPYMQVYAWF